MDWSKIPNNKIICWCRQVKKGEIVKAIKNGATTIQKVEEATYAGADCRRCITHIEGLIDYYAKSENEGTIQLDLFGNKD